MDPSLGKSCCRTTKLNQFFKGLLAIASVLIIFSIAKASWAACNVDLNPGQCICHNLSGGSGEICPSGSGQVNGHDTHLASYCCTFANHANAPLFCNFQDQAGSSAPFLDCSCTNVNTHDLFGKCNGCGNGVVDNEPGCCDPNISNCSNSTNLCEKCDDGANLNGDGCSADCQKECVGGCDDSNSCTTDSCDNSTGLCKNIPNTGTTCDDNDKCTNGDSCQNDGSCSGTAVVCSAKDQCHDAGTCDPGTGVCSDPQKPNGDSCQDGDICSDPDTCQDGSCVGGTDICQCKNDNDCPSDQCHTPHCDLETHTCDNTPVTDGTSCNDGDLCTQTDTCQQGLCTGANDVTCATPDQCHDQGTCDPGTGKCSNPDKEEGSPCSDGNACTLDDACIAGSCTSGSPVECSASDQCHNIGVCDPANGTCSDPTKTDDTPCEDGDVCSNPDTCQSGICEPGANTCECKADSDCAGTADQCENAHCDLESHTCQNTPKEDNTPCDDQDACTDGDSCQKGSCTPNTELTCVATDSCHVAGICDKKTGECSNPNADDGTLCDDSDACTQSDTCESGSCVGKNPVTCSPLDQCHNAGTCDPKSGLCSDPTKTNDTPCDDQDSCSNPDTCQEGSCVGGPNTCECKNDNDCSGTVDQCHNPHCNKVTNKCENTPKDDNTTCDDGDACTQTDSCQQGECTGSNDVVCADPDQCHEAGSCDPQTGKCSNPAKDNGSACSDSDLCTQSDSCQEGKCVGSNPVVCTAEDQCHNIGTCSPDTGVCSNPDKPNGSECEDGDSCSGPDSCQDGSCLPGESTCECRSDEDCPADDCHVGNCDLETHTCQNLMKENGTLCDDSQACTQGDSCQSGQCVGDPVVCQASDQCHDAGLCDSETGECSNPVKESGSTCTDGNLCTSNDQCSDAGVCSGTTVSCDDGDACTADSCNPQTGCSHDAIANCPGEPPPPCTDANNNGICDDDEVGGQGGNPSILCLTGEGGTATVGNGVSCGGCALHSNAASTPWSSLGLGMILSVGFLPGLRRQFAKLANKVRK